MLDHDKQIQNEELLKDVTEPLRHEWLDMNRFESIAHAQLLGYGSTITNCLIWL